MSLLLISPVISATSLAGVAAIADALLARVATGRSDVCPLWELGVTDMREDCELLEGMRCL